MTAWQYTPMALPQALAAILCLIAFVVVMRRRETGALARSLLLMLASHIFWAGAGALEFTATTLWAKILLSQISYIGIVLGPYALLHFTHAYIHDGASPPRIWRVVSGVAAIVILGACWTNSAHGLLWQRVTLVERYDHPFANYERGPFFWVTVGYCYSFMLASSVRLIRHTLRIGGIFSRQSFIILAATLAPWLTSLAYVLRLGPAPELDHTPVGLAFTGLLLTLAVARLRLFEVAHVPSEILFARVPDPVLVIGRDNHLLRANSAAQDRLGLSSDRFGEPLEQALNKEPGLVPTLIERPNEPRWKTIRQVGEVWWEIESGPVGAKSRCRLVLLRDITDQKNTEKRLADALARAEQLRVEADAANAAKSVFLAQVSHDLRTPLHAILGISELLLAGPLDERVRADTATIREAGQMLLRLINDLLDLSRIEAGRIELAYDPFRIEDAIQPVIELLAVKARAKNLALAHTIDPALPPALCGDVDRLRQILVNLGGNAVKFTPHGSITLAAQSEPGALAITVSDTGPGIPADRIPTLFEPFDRGDHLSVQKIEGTGLGLAIARRLALAMGGDIDVSSRLGHGSVFTVRIPIVHADAPIETPGLRAVRGTAPAVRIRAESPLPATTNERAAAPAQTHALRVLLADDQEISRRVSRALLRACGCVVDETPDGPETIEAIRAGTYDVAVLDGQMVAMDGWEVARRLRAGEAGEAARTMPIVALTADLSPEARARWRAADVGTIIPKPGNLRAITAALEPARTAAGKPPVA